MAMDSVHLLSSATSGTFGSRDTASMLSASTSAHIASSASQLLGDRIHLLPLRTRSRARVTSTTKAGLRWQDPSSLGVDSRAGSARRHRLIKAQAAKQTFSSFDDLLKNSQVPVLVDFYATWCGPCQFMVPVLNEVGQALKNKIKIVKIDSEKYPNIASRYDVQALPTLVLFQNGQPIDRLEGAMAAPELIRRIEGVLAAAKARARD